MKQLYSARFSLLPVLLCLLLSIAPGHTAHAEESEAALLERYPADSINSVEQAFTAQRQAKEVRQIVEKDFAASTQDCYQTFFVSRCLKKIKEERRVRIDPIRRIEVEAAAYLRKEKAAERDRGVAERESRATQPRSAPDLSISGVSRERAPDKSDAKKK